ncbi:hypothetical protein Q4553_13385 [Tenacibaculum soleae]|uniref:hypothetical protein n=1 Tax=Tenacibaculum soleae TaxID=447689 RepID=UPI0026E24B18|nr:hypothetical protein [Tenacibaculum soleae]MDO6745556.1 hypothetical protein [Tenacibaculum soleae]
MKKVKLISLISIITIFSSCDFNQSVNKDLTTGAYSRGNGIGCDDVKIQINGDVDNRNEFIYGEKVYFVFNDITGLKRENGNVFPGLSIDIVKNEKDTVLQYKDLFDNLENGTDLSPLQLQANFTSALPNENNEKYKVFIKIWDKKGTGTFQYELPFSVKENELLNINSSNIDYSNIYLWDETKKSIVTKKEVNVESTLILILEGLEGLDVVENKVFPSFSIEITDNSGNQVLSSSNILEEYRESGIDYDAFKNGQLPVTITFSPGQINNPCKLRASLKDLNSEKNILITSELEIK